MFEAVCSEILGYGPIDPLLNDDSVSEVMVNGPKQVYVERSRASLSMTDVQFQDNDHVMRIIERIVSPLGRRIDRVAALCGRPPAQRLPRERGDPADRRLRAPV